MALLFHEKTDDKTLLLKALTWSLRATELKDTYSFNDTVAALYLKLGNKPKAREYAQKALKQARVSGANATDTAALLKKIEGD
ncbi:hypothetical protein [Larkinella rosea]|uniref:Tetratricopeptide repeat protein n=1 Tax=Larkinella rosea TaxID=2025312 RepID=A0A3P1C1K7_9BACT|nr:hypothetical protein [Larkinella rosea]RRB07310.1 hypothetical protein EHT25_05915 [Larkinella rosea]